MNEITNEITQVSFTKAINNIRLVYGAVKAAGILPHNNDYEDFVQEGLITYALMIVANPRLTKAEMDKLAFRKIVWQSIDTLRRQKFLAEKTSYSLDDGFDHEELTENAADSDKMVICMEANEAIDGLNNVEQLILKEHFLRGKSLKDLAKECDISIQTIYRAQKRTRQYLRQYITV
ncbi:hypothetical protein FC62_GL000859 [Amylolactobacillus amylotrophicus DSM 20534]|nr:MULTISPECIES: sigma-70 family RNA polymerase sigma factor [Amylolactobacillus]APT18301.1 hypothetical protein LA20533_03010 [Amylolactobacillus amylophilus DSM 20533 = JCM 1125]KRK38087.1 hypothetical protein FC62_GL000859 [Amylolactobacillus amylotrophicus DSM 20534]GED81085.1 hypothetical protein LAM01_15580 [Amylolactobacillus amylophilus]